MNSENQPTEDAAVYVISVAAELSGLHPQTLRQYDRMGLVSPGRASFPSIQQPEPKPRPLVSYSAKPTSHGSSSLAATSRYSMHSIGRT